MHLQLRPLLHWKLMQVTGRSFAFCTHLHVLLFPYCPVPPLEVQKALHSAAELMDGAKNVSRRTTRGWLRLQLYSPCAVYAHCSNAILLCRVCLYCAAKKKTVC